MKRLKKYKEPCHQNLGDGFTRLDKKRDQTIYDAMDKKRKMTKAINRIMRVRREAAMKFAGDLGGDGGLL